jgi:hypothetical protein
VQLRDPLVEGGKSTVVRSSQLGQVCVCHLPMADNTGEFDISERDAVRPEFMTRITSDRANDLVGRTHHDARSGGWADDE